MPEHSVRTDVVEKTTGSSSSTVDLERLHQLGQQSRVQGVEVLGAVEANQRHRGGDIDTLKRSTPLMQP
jgi:hypothetical protein